MRRCGHVQKRNSHNSKRIRKLEVTDKRPRGRTKKRFRDVINNTNLVVVRDEDAEKKGSMEVDDSL